MMKDASGPGATPTMCLAASACAFFLGHIPALAGRISEVRLIPLCVSAFHAAARKHYRQIRRAMKFPLAALLFHAAVANAATVWTIGPNSQGEAITFTDEQGPCVGAAKVAVWQKPGATPVPACYRIEGPAVLLAFFDGDSATIPAAALVKARSL